MTLDNKTGVLLLQLGTPSGANKRAVFHYLREFLDDPRVVDLPAVARKLLLYGIILPFRVRTSTKAYQAIWDLKKGSPLLFHTKAVVEKLQQQLGSQFLVKMGMRYGQPSLVDATKALLACKKIIVLPLFPQYASASSGSAIAHTLSTLTKEWNIPSFTWVQDYYQNPAYLDAQAALIKPYLKKDAHLVLSYHSLPVRHLKKSSQCSCDQSKACPAISSLTRWCYRAQCYDTTRELIKRLPATKYEVAFQSRLGRTVWAGPDLNTVLQKLNAQKVRDIVVACPSFVSDCLETLEEVGIRAKEDWLAMGGKTLTLIPCLNAEPKWIGALAQLVEQHT